MYPFDKDINNRRKNPFDFFGFDDDFDQMFRNMERMWEYALKDLNFDRLEPGKTFFHGFNIRIGPDEKPIIEEFGNHSKKIDEGKTIVSEEREPLTDIIEGYDEIFITVEIPGVEKEDINLNINDASLDIDIDSPERKYRKSIDLPCTVFPNKAKATYKNGILDIVVKRREKKKGNDGYRVNID